jgi:steroid delta-isomerase
MNARKFAEEWIASWNRRDIEAVLAHYTDDVIFVSPTAHRVIGRARVEGKADLRAYWTAALAKIGSLKFTLDRTLWDEAARTLMIVYVSQRPDETKRAAELFRFDERGTVVEGEAFYGALL